MNAPSSDPPPATSRPLLAHVVVDVCAIAALAFFVWMGLNPELGASMVVGVQLGYLAQLNKARAPRSPLLALLAVLVGAAWSASHAAREISQRWFS